MMAGLGGKVCDERHEEEVERQDSVLSGTSNASHFKAELLTLFHFAAQ